MMRLLLETVICSGILFGAVWLIRHFLHRRLSPVLQAALWLLVVVRLCVPVLFESPVHFFTVPQQVRQAEVTEPSAVQPVYPDMEKPAGTTETAGAAAAEEAAAGARKTTARAKTGGPAARPLSAEQTALLVWAVGAALFAAWFLYAAGRMRRELEKNGQGADARVDRLFGLCREELGIKRNIPVVLAENICTPAMTVSLFPKIILPRKMAESMSDRELRYAVRHELVHYKRGDHLLSIVMRVLEAAWWFNPFVWLTSREMLLDVESACDSMVVRGMEKGDKADYARTIVSLFAQEGHAQFMLGMALGSTKKVAERRVRGVYRREKTRRGTRAAAVLLVCVLSVCCFTTACQPTPEKQAVAGKGNAEEQLKQSSENGDSGHKVGNMQFPAGNYTYDATAADGDLTIHVDAPVLLPDTGKLPSADVVPMDFTQEMVTGMFNYLFPDEKPLVYDDTITKADIEANILFFKEALAMGVIGGEEMTDRDIAATKEEIERLEEEYKVAPETKNEPFVSDGTMRRINSKGYDCYSLSAMSGDGTANFSVTTGFDRSPHAANPEAAPTNQPDGEAVPTVKDSYLSYSRIERESYQPFTLDGAVRIARGDPLPEAATGKLNITLEDAVKAADGFFAAGGITDIKLFGAYVVDNHGTGDLDNSYAPATDWAYQLFYTRTLNGTQAAYASTGTISTDGAYDVPWEQETIEVTVANDGITDIVWRSPCKTTDMLTDDADIIDFETAVGTFEQAVVNTFAPMTKRGNDENPAYYTIKADIDQIRLALIRIKQKDHPGEYMGVYVPAYVFYGTIKTHNKANETDEYDTYMTSAGGGSSLTPGPTIVFAINAVDGSVINVMESY